MVVTLEARGLFAYSASKPILQLSDQSVVELRERVAWMSAPSGSDRLWSWAGSRSDSGRSCNSAISGRFQRQCAIAHERRNAVILLKVLKSMLAARRNRDAVSRTPRFGTSNVNGRFFASFGTSNVRRAKNAGPRTRRPGTPTTSGSPTCAIRSRRSEEFLPADVIDAVFEGHWEHHRHVRVAMLSVL